MQVMVATDAKVMAHVRLCVAVALGVLVAQNARQPRFFGRVPWFMIRVRCVLLYLFMTTFFFNARAHKKKKGCAWKAS